MVFPFDYEERIDPKYIGVPNVNFSIADEEDEKDGEYKAQRLERGFDDSELWNLDCTIAKFVLPRLKAFRVNPHGWPSRVCSYEEWLEILDKIIFALSYIATEDDDDFTDETYDKVENGLKLFGIYFRSLWD